MVKAMYAGVAGLKAHQSKMDVISNNIANVNTWGYKTMDTSFKESIYQTMTGGSGGSTAEGGMGGTNPSMVGYGAMVSTISSNFTKGTQVPTGQALDMFIDGTGFFAVGPMYGEGESTSPGKLNMSRVGDFRVINNYLVDGNGRYVYGFSMNKGGEFYNPETIKDRKVETGVQIPLDGIPDNIPPTTKNGVTTSVTYEAVVPLNGMMTVTTTTVETKSPSEFFPDGADKITAPSTDQELDILVRKLNDKDPVNAATDPTIRYKLSDDKKTVTITSAAPAGEAALVFADVDPTNLLDGLDLATKEGIAEAIVRANGTTNVGRPTGVTYSASADGMKVIATTTTTNVSSRGNSDGPIVKEGVPGATAGTSRAAITAILQKESKDGVSYTLDPNDKTIVTKQVIDIDVSKEIPLPKATTVKNDDGSTTSISWEDDKIADGKATKITITSTPVSADAVKKGPDFDDGRMVFDPVSGTYTMAEGVDTLKPIKLPTTCTYYDDNGVAHEETDIQLGSFSIKQDGKIYGTSVATGNTYLLGAVALVSVSNPSGMTKADGPYYTPGGSSGTPRISEARGAAGELAPEFLESANVDIATEFSGMITTQRGFQANSKIITVTDEMLQELVNMKR